MELITRQGYQILLSYLNIATEKRRSFLAETRGDIIASKPGEHDSDGDSRRRALDEIDQELQRYDLALKGSSITSAPSDLSKVNFGTKVMVQDLDKKVTEIYRIVGRYEVGALQDVYFPDQDHPNTDVFVSYTSPIGKALLNQEVGKIVQVTVPMGNRKLKILNIADCFEGVHLSNEANTKITHTLKEQMG
jgi:transcription elongation GreA/GreB family factor